MKSSTALGLHIAATMLGACGAVGGAVGGSRTVVLVAGALLMVGGVLAFQANKSLFIPPLVRLRLATANEEEQTDIHHANARMMGTVSILVGAILGAGAVFL